MPSMPTRCSSSFQQIVVGMTATGLAMALVGCGTTNTLNGAGASFPAPI